MNAPLVSIITPCYNGEHVIGRLIQSIINQTYDNIEIIIINDGSTDKSGEIIESYREKVIERGYLFTHHQQENQGLGGAINSGLKLFSGEFFCWPDADDYLEPQSVERRVKFLVEHPEYAVVTSNAYVRKWDDLERSKLLATSKQKTNLQEEQFELLLNGESIFCPGCHMVRAKMFIDVNPEREIYPAKRGQNWQLLLPLYYKYKRFFLDEPLYNYIDYPNSMSKNEPTEESFLNRYNEHEVIIKKTLEMIELVQNIDMSEYKNNVSARYAKYKMNVAIRFDNKILFEANFREKYQLVGLDGRDLLMYFQMKLKIVKRIVEGVKRVRNVWRY